MSTVALPPGLELAPIRASQRFGWALTASLLAHGLAVLLFLGLLPHLPLPKASRLGTPAPLAVTLVTVQPVPAAPPPETPVPAVEVAPPAPVPQEPTPPPPPKPAPKPTPDPAPPVPMPPPVPVAPSPPLGVFAQSDSHGEIVASDSPPPPGDIAVGAVQDSGRIGGVQTLRLAQKYPTQVSKPPRLRNPLVVAYPPDPARAHLEARIAALLLVDASGKIVETTLYPDEAQFGPSVQAALAGAALTPGEVGGAPVPYWTILEFVFTMRKPAAVRQP